MCDRQRTKAILSGSPDHSASAELLSIVSITHDAHCSCSLSLPTGKASDSSVSEYLAITMLLLYEHYSRPLCVMRHTHIPIQSKLQHKYMSKSILQIDTSTLLCTFQRFLDWSATTVLRYTSTPASCYRMQLMENVEHKAPEAKLEYCSSGPHLESTTPQGNPRPTSLCRAKLVVGQFLRHTLHAHRPAHKRASNTGNTGFVVRREIKVPTATHPLRKSRPSSAASSRSVLSVRSVELFGSTPDIFITSPTTRGRRSHIVHSGSDSSVPSNQSIAAKHLRYSHPTATAVITPARAEGSSKSMKPFPLNQVFCDNDSRLSTPKTADLARDFPGEVNVRKIARESLFGYEDTKAIVDGLLSRSKVSKINLNAAATEHSAGDPAGNYHGYKAYNPRVMRAEEPEATVSKHRQATLDALTGSGQSGTLQMSLHQRLPITLLPGPPQAFLRPSSPASLASTNEDVFGLDDDKALVGGHSCAGSARPGLSYDSLSFIPYSKFLDHQPSSAASKQDDAISNRSMNESREHLSPQTLRHRQIYASVEALDWNFPSFDQALSTAMLKAAQAEEHKIKTASSVPEVYSMNENGFPIFTPPMESYVTAAKYEKRTLTDDELKTLQKEEKRKSRLAKHERKATKAGHAETRISLLGRLRKSLIA